MKRSIYIFSLIAMIFACSSSWGMSCEDLFLGIKGKIAISEGMPESYTRGGQEINSLLKLAERLRRQYVDPNATHIQEFEEMIDPHLQFTKRAIESQNTEDTVDRLKLLSKFWREARAKKSSAQVTYRWWVLFNFRLSILLTPKNKRTIERGGVNDVLVEAAYKNDAWKTEARLNAVIRKLPPPDIFGSDTLDFYMDFFPKHIIFPTIVGDIGISELNRVFSTGVHPFGLIPDRLMNEGREMYPDYFFGHELIHLINEKSLFKMWGTDGRAVQRFHNKYVRMVELLPVLERQMVEFVYFLATRESTMLAGDLIRDGAYDVTNTLLGRRLEETVTHSMDLKWYAGLLPSWVNKTSREDVTNYLNQSGREFNRFATRVNSYP